MPLCSEMITDEDIYDYIVVNLPGINKMLQSNPDVCIQKVDDQWLVADYIEKKGTPLIMMRGQERLPMNNAEA